jgi:hypothetical protein
VITVRNDLSTALDQAWQQLSRPGTWWTGLERNAIVAEARACAACPNCAQRRERKSIGPCASIHKCNVHLPSWAVTAIHDICRDPKELTFDWYNSLKIVGLSDERYVELLSVVSLTVAIDTFDFSIGSSIRELPVATPGSPTLARPVGAKPGLAWMPTLSPDDRTSADPDLYQELPGPRKRGGGNIHLALSLVPASMLHWWNLFEVMYMSSFEMRHFTREYRAISHSQIELLAARVAVLNHCFY